MLVESSIKGTIERIVASISNVSVYLTAPQRISLFNETFNTNSLKLAAGKA